MGYSKLSSHQIGSIGSDATLKDLRAKYGDKVDIESEVSAEFSDKSRTKFDFVVYDPETKKILEVVESKTNGADLTKNQRKFYEQGLDATFVGDKAKNLGIDNVTVNTKTHVASIFHFKVNRYTGSASKRTVFSIFKGLIKKR